MTSEWIYVRGRIQGMNVVFTANTGDIWIVQSDRVYRNIPIDVWQHLEQSFYANQCVWSTCTGDGEGQVSDSDWKMSFIEEIVVAEIEDKALLGLDVLMRGPGETIIIKMSKGIIQLNGCSIPCIQNHQPRELRRVCVADHYQIPARSEAIIGVFVVRRDHDGFEDDYLQVPTDYGSSSSGNKQQCD